MVIAKPASRIKFHNKFLPTCKAFPCFIMVIVVHNINPQKYLFKFIPMSLISLENMKPSIREMQGLTECSAS
jgi:hypothetical protein